MYLGFTINLFSGTSLLAANLSNDLGNWLFIAKLVFIAVRDDQSRAHARFTCSTGRARVAADGLPKNARVYAIAALVLWSLAMVAGRFTAYPNFVEAWLGF